MQEEMSHSLDPLSAKSDKQDIIFMNRINLDQSLHVSVQLFQPSRTQTGYLKNCSDI